MYTFKKFLKGHHLKLADDDGNILVDKDCDCIVLDCNGAEEFYEVAEYCNVTRDGKKSRVADLKAGDDIDLPRSPRVVVRNIIATSQVPVRSSTAPALAQASGGETAAPKATKGAEPTPSPVKKPK